MDKGLCGFCRQAGVEDICGQLHREKTNDGPVVAHHKCMQYSALLVQYKFSHFGGFKIEKVLEEYKRGKKTACSLCKVSKKKGIHKTGATAGCAVKSCRKTFHYYCARMSENAVTKRLVVNIKSQQRRTVLYRVFCSKAHEMLYRKNLKQYVAGSQTKKTAGKQDPESDLDDEDVESAEFNDGDFDQLSQTTNTSLISLDLSSISQDSKTDSFLDNCVAVKEQSALSSEGSETDDPESKAVGSSNDTESDDPSSSKRKSLDCFTDSELPSKRLKKDLNGSITRNSTDAWDEHSVDVSTSDGDQSADRRKSKQKDAKLNTEMHTDSAASLSCDSDTGGHRSARLPGKQGKEKRLRDSVDTSDKSATQSPVRLNIDETGDAKARTKVSSNGKHASGGQLNVSSGYPECALCVVDSAECGSVTAKQLKQKASQRWGLPPNRVFVWQHLKDSVTLPSLNIIYFIKDLTKYLTKGQATEVYKLLFDSGYLEKQNKTLYQNFISFMGGIEDVNYISKGLWTTIRNNLKDCTYGTIFEVDGKFALGMLLDDNGIDRTGNARLKLGLKKDENETLVTWTPATVVTKTDIDEVMVKMEKQTITKWLTEHMADLTNMEVFPEEKFLLSAGDSVVEDIARSLPRKLSVPSREKACSVLCFKKMDKNVVNVSEYCRKVLLSKLANNSKKFAIIFDMASFSSTTIQRELKKVFTDNRGNNMPVTIKSVFDPSSIAVSCILAEINSDCLLESDERQLENSSPSNGKRVIEQGWMTPTTSRKSQRIVNSPATASPKTK